MPAGGGHNGSRLEDQLRLVVVESPDTAGPLVDALAVADIGAWMWVESERALYLSPHVFALLGITLEPRGDVLSRFIAGVHPEDQESVRQLLRRDAPSGAFRLRYRFAPPDGPLRWIEDRGRIERGPAGELIRQGGAMREVTREVGRELEQREADARLQALVNAMPFAVWGRSGPDLTVTHQNAESIDTWGDMRGRALRDAPAEGRVLWQGPLADVMTGQVVRSRYRQERQGDIRVFNEIIAPVIVEDQVTGAVGVAIDVTEEARASTFAALLTDISTDLASRSADQLREGLSLALQKVAAFVGAPIAVLAESGGDGRLQITHWWTDPATGRDEPRALIMDGIPIRALLQRGAANAAVIVYSRADLPDGSAEREWLAERHLQSIAIVPARHGDGALTILGLAGASEQVVQWPEDTASTMHLVAALFGSVLARARAEAQRKAVERRMQEAQKLESLGVLAGGVAHEFNNLLTAILGHASLLRVDVPEHEATTSSLDQIEKASKRAADLCRQMLAYAGRGRFFLQAMSLNALILEMQSLLGVTAPKKCTLQLELAPDLPSTVADEAQLRQLIMNLVINAAEAVRDGGGTITLRTASGYRTAAELASTVFSPQLEDGYYVSLTVSDDGEGMTPEVAARIFDPFFSTKFAGRGLGLAAVVGIVRAHRGALRVDSTYGEGSSFELILPAHEGVTEALDGTSVDPAASLKEWRTSGTVLVVDDEFGVRDLVRAVLERAGLTVILATDGRQGVETFRALAGDVRLVLLDLTMPQLDGREALEEMRAIRRDVPAVLMSGYSPDDLVNASTHAFLQKPFTPAKLRAVVKRTLGE